MTTVALIPETEFDTSGTPGDFCPECEHAPCVAGGRGFCEMRPRFTGAMRMKKETFALLDGVPDSNPLRHVLWLAVDAIGFAACGHDTRADNVLEEFAAIHAALQDELR